MSYYVHPGKPADERGSSYSQFQLWQNGTAGLHNSATKLYYCCLNCSKVCVDVPQLHVHELHDVIWLFTAPHMVPRASIKLDACPRLNWETRTTPTVRVLAAAAGSWNTNWMLTFILISPQSLCLRFCEPVKASAPCNTSSGIVRYEPV